MRSLLICIAMVFAQQATAAVTINLYESGGNVQAVLSGSVDLNATLELVGSFAAYNGYSPALGGLAFTNGTTEFYDINVGTWTPFGPGGFGNWDSSSGDAFALFTNPQVGVPAGYVSGSPLSATATKNGTTLAALGFTLGTHVTTLSSDGGTDTVTVIVGAAPPTLTIVKDIAFDDQGVASIGDFGVEVVGEGPLVFGAGDPIDERTRYTATPLTLLAATPYSLTELNLPGYAEHGWSCTNGDSGPYNDTIVTLDVGEDVTCTITNERENFDLTLTKFMEQSGFPDTFIMDADGTLGVEAGDGATSTARVFYGDAAYIDELAGAGTDLSYWNASYDCYYPDGAPFGDGPGHRFEFDMPTANLNCVITNERKFEEITFVKQAFGFDGEFCFAIIDVFGNPTGGPCIQTSGGYGSIGGLGLVGHYQFNEIIEAGFVLQSASCSNGDNPEEGFDLVPGQPLTCTWVNVMPDAIPVNNPWALLLMVMMVLGIGWYYRPVSVRRH